jgi:hypothetical protein
MTWVGTAPRNERYEEALTAIARAIVRGIADVDRVLIGPTTAFLEGAEAERFILPADLRAAGARHVESAGPFEPGDYILEAPRGAEHESDVAMEAVLVKLDRDDLTKSRQGTQ